MRGGVVVRDDVNEKEEGYEFEDGVGGVAYREGGQERRQATQNEGEVKRVGQEARNGRQRRGK